MKYQAAVISKNWNSNLVQVTPATLKGPGLKLWKDNNHLRHPRPLRLSKIYKLITLSCSIGYCDRKSYSKDFCVFAIMLSTEIWNTRKFRIESYDPNSTVDLDIWSRRQSDQAKMIINPVIPPIRIYSIKNLARASARTKSSTGLPGSGALMLIVMMIWHCC